MIDQPHNSPNTMDRQLDELFANYREACGDPEPSANFMPGVWAKIDARRGWRWHVGVYARRIALASGAVCALVVGVEAGQHWTKSEELISRGYVEVLRESAATEDYAYLPTMEVAERF